MTRASRVPAERGTKITFTFDGQAIVAYEGETLAAALLAANVTCFGVARDGRGRLPLCNMGTCFDCAVTVDGQPLMRACLTDVKAGMRVTRHEAS